MTKRTLLGSPKGPSLLRSRSLRLALLTAVVTGLVTSGFNRLADSDRDDDDPELEEIVTLEVVPAVLSTAGFSVTFGRMRCGLRQLPSPGDLAPQGRYCAVTGTLTNNTDRAGGMDAEASVFVGAEEYPLDEAASTVDDLRLFPKHTNKATFLFDVRPGVLPTHLRLRASDGAAVEAQLRPLS